LLAYSFAKSGNNPEWLLEKTTREKMFYLATISWWSDKEKPQEH
jgi:hypothetical protein